MGQLGMTFAGVGFIVAFAIGVPLVRWGVRKGLNTYPVGSVPEEVKTGLLAPENRPCGLHQVTQNSNVDSLALQLALVLGAEGDGLRDDTVAHCEYTVRIPMSHGVDSLNVAAAAALAFWEVRPRGRA